MYSRLPFTKSLLLASVAVIMLSSCGDRAAIVAEAPQAEALELLSVVATHSVKAPSPARVIGFVPNSVASWTGKLIVVGQDGSLSSMGIEGTGVKVIDADGDYSDVVGLARENAAGVFVALTQSGDLRAFIESSDAGDFSALSVSAPALDVAAFCKGPIDRAGTLYILGQDGVISEASISVDNDKAVQVTVTQTLALSTPAKVEACAAALDGTIYAAYPQAEGATAITKFDAQTREAAASFSYASSDIHNLAILPSRDGALHLSVKSAAAPIAQIYSGGESAQHRSLQVRDGLSIAGLSGQSAGLFSTPYSFGGSAFENGIVVIPEQGTNRLVVLSGSYLAQQMALPADQ